LALADGRARREVPSEPVFLTLGHINGGGTRHRRKLGSGSTILFDWLRNRGYPPGFQVLCSNCNHGRHRNGGGCPHQIKQRTKRRRARP